MPNWNFAQMNWDRPRYRPNRRIPRGRITALGLVGLAALLYALPLFKKEPIYGQIKAETKPLVQQTSVEQLTGNNGLTIGSLLDELEKSEGLDPQVQRGIITFDVRELESITYALRSNPREVVGILTKKWIDMYSTTLRSDLEGAVSRSTSSIAEIKAVFQQEEVPTELAFLAIPESSCRRNVKSRRAKAVGYFQFMPSTGRGSGLYIGGGIDERENIYLSARACARHLKWLHSRFNNDWNLTLAAYNSGMPWKYLKVRSEYGDGTVSYENYLRYLADDLDRIVRQANHRKRSERHEQRLRRSMSAFIRENLNYPPKFNAVLHMLEMNHSGYFSTTPENGLGVTKVANSYYQHTVKRGENLYKISRRYGVNVHTIKRTNNIRGSLIRAGQVLHIGIPTSLQDILAQTGMSREDFHYLNPHIPGRVIPNGAIIVYPIPDKYD